MYNFSNFSSSSNFVLSYVWMEQEMIHLGESIGHTLIALIYNSPDLLAMGEGKLVTRVNSTVSSQTFGCLIRKVYGNVEDTSKITTAKENLFKGPSSYTFVTLLNSLQRSAWHPISLERAGKGTQMDKDSFTIVPLHDFIINLLPLIASVIPNWIGLEIPERMLSYKVRRKEPKQDTPILHYCNNDNCDCSERNTTATHRRPVR